MIKAKFKITGSAIREIITEATADFQKDEYAVQYEMENGSIFMFEQYKRSLSNFVVTVILDFSQNNLPDNEFVLQCYAMGERNRTELNFLNYEKSTLKDFRAHIFGYAERNNFQWSIGELEIDESAN